MKLYLNLEQGAGTPDSEGGLPPARSRWILVGLIAISFGLSVSGIRQNLPYAAEADEPQFMTCALHIAGSGDLNPGWFGHPGSTVIYPLAAILHAWNALTHHGMFFHHDPNLQRTFGTNPTEFYLLGRLLSIAYAVMSVPLVYKLGRRALGERVGLMGSCLWVVHPIVISYAHVLRSDSAATFYCLLSLWLCLRLADRPSIGNQITAGSAVGLGIATRYFAMALIPVLVATDALILWRRISERPSLRAILLGMAAGLLAVLVSFALSTPFFFLDFKTVSENLALEAETTHLGADGLSHWGNFWWYLTQAIPRSLSWPQAVLAASGIAILLWRREPKQVLLLIFTTVFLVEMSLLALHWLRWTIQVLPLLALFAADALSMGMSHLSSSFRLSRSWHYCVVTAALLAAIAIPCCQTVLLSIRQANPSTRILSRQWIMQNLPPGSRIAQEWYAAPLGGADFAVSEQVSLALNRELEDYNYRGYRYLVVSSYVYGRYLAEPQRYYAEVAFYRALFARGRLLREFGPSITRGGPVIRIYELPLQ